MVGHALKEPLESIRVVVLWVSPVPTVRRTLMNATPDPAKTEARALKDVFLGRGSVPAQLTSTDQLVRVRLITVPRGRVRTGESAARGWVSISVPVPVDSEVGTVRMTFRNVRLGPVRMVELAASLTSECSCVSVERDLREMSVRLILTSVAVSHAGMICCRTVDRDWWN